VTAEPAVLQRLRPGEGRRLRAIRLRALAQDPDAFYRTHAEEVALPERSWEEWIGRERTVLLVAVQDGRDVALGALVPDRQVPDELAVVAFWVDPGARGRGVGRLLLDALVAHARADGAPAVTLGVADSNAAAVDLYAAAGFEHTGQTGAFAPPREHVTEHKRRLLLTAPT
jgi:ribosomal protein S18 acetylase RimI-like enzyme